MPGPWSGCSVTFVGSVVVVQVAGVAVDGGGGEILAVGGDFHQDAFLGAVAAVIGHSLHGRSDAKVGHTVQKVDHPKIMGSDHPKR